MGNSHPTNKTGKKVLQQKLENANKTKILSLCEHNLEKIPDPVLQITALKTLDVSKNKLTSLRGLEELSTLKSLSVEDNKLPAGALSLISSFSKLQTLKAGGNLLGKQIASEPGVSSSDPLPSKLPAALKQVGLDRNFLSNVPRPILSPTLTKLEKLDLSSNQLATVPPEISNLIKLAELKLDNNMIVSLPESMGGLKSLKTLSLKNNALTVQSTHFSAKNPQPLPASLFADTLLIDLNLHGNSMTSTQLNEFDGYDKFMDRRQKVKTKDLYGGALTNLDVCGLE